MNYVIEDNIEKAKASGNVLTQTINESGELVNVKDINTQVGKIRCNERVQKKALNKTNIRSNLSQVISDDTQIEQAMSLIMNNRETKIIHVLTKPKSKMKTIETTL